MRRFTNDYNPDGKQRRDDARKAAGNRCLRCGHPYECGKHGKGEWTPCDCGCTHAGELRITKSDGDQYLLTTPHTVKFVLSPSYRGGLSIISIEAHWRILTVHHLDGDKANDAWWNTLALCQRCHLEIQGKLDPEVPFFLHHSEWIKPYVAGFYAKKYEGRDITRQEAESRIDELLAYELRCK